MRAAAAEKGTCGSRAPRPWLDRPGFAHLRRAGVRDPFFRAPLSPLTPLLYSLICVFPPDELAMHCISCTRMIQRPFFTRAHPSRRP